VVGRRGRGMPMMPRATKRVPRATQNPLRAVSSMLYPITMARGV